MAEEYHDGCDNWDKGSRKSEMLDGGQHQEGKCGLVGGVYSGEVGSTWIGPIEKDPWTHGGKYGSGRKLPSCQLNREFRLGEITKNMQIFVLKIIILL